MKRALRNILALAGLLLMIGSFAWMQLRQAERPARPKEPKAAQAPTTPSPFAVVVLDPGHGGQDSGAMCGGVLEKDLTLDVTRRIDRLLDSEGIATLMTRVGDTYVSLADRAAFANRVRNCIFVSVHLTKITSRWPAEWRPTTPRIKLPQVRSWLRGCLFCGDRFRIRRMPKAKISPDLFRKRWWHAPGLWIAAYRVDNFL